ncbi:MAG: putative ATPase [Glaciecola sp.]|jgi:predicted ATPase
MVVDATSNCAPHELYKNGLQRVSFFLAINAIHQNMNVVKLAGTKDHRERVLHTLQNYFVINCLAINNNTISFDFKDLCLGPRSHTRPDG